MEESGPLKINYLRLSVTDRCNLRCVYCTYWRDWQKLPSGEILRYEELLRLTAIAAEAGIRKVRLTGGEPLLRRGLVNFIEKLKRLPGIDQVCLTTNGVLLKELAPALFGAGLRRLNVSLDTLKRERYRRITGSDRLPAVLAGLEKATSLGFNPLKINCVVLRGLNDDEILDIARLARDHPFQVRFIELMPTASRTWWQRHFLPMAEVRQRLAVLGSLEPSIREAAAGPARIFRAPGFRGELGFISPMSQHHCGVCNRLRLSSDGALRPCLLEEKELDLKGALRQGVSDALLGHLFQKVISLKLRKSAHPITGLKAIPCDLPMVSIGG
ncbi:MAG: GTP 3',8-cyclase MoaA [Deltaproteobacteria bacterium]|nr:GTP 3',8-cyclase MoaA [Deltaproteobacteria bacterium]